MRRRSLVILAFVPVLALAGVFGYGPVVRRSVADRLRAWARRHGGEVSWRSIEVSVDGIRIRGLVLRDSAHEGLCPLAETDTVTLRVRPWELLLGTFRRHLSVRGAHVCVERTAGADNYSWLRARGGRGRARARRMSVSFERCSLDVRDRRHGLVVRAVDLSGRWEARQGLDVTLRSVHGRWQHVEGAAEELRVWTRGLAWQGVLVEGGRLALLPRLVLTGVSGRIRPDGDGGVTFFLRGSYGGLEVRLWQARGHLRRGGRRGRLDFTVQRLSLDRLSALLDRSRWGKSLVERGKAWLALDAHVVRMGDDWTFRGAAHVSNVTVRDARLSRQPVKGIGFDLSLSGTYDAAADHLRVPRAILERKGIVVRSTVDIQRLRGKPRVRVEVDLPRTDCGALIQALPDGLVPQLKRMRFSGPVWMRVFADVDFAYLTEDTVEFDPRVTWRHCRVLSAPWELSVERLKRPFLHRVRDGKIVTQFEIGPRNPDFVPLPEISRHVVNAILTTEDTHFFEHHGFIRREFRRAFARNIIARKFRYGASSISMQLVKNVMLDREKTLARKLQELVLTAYVERHLSKQRILEIYLNAIEFGPGIYGIGRAARHFFGKAAALVEPQEAAYLSTILPSPKKRYINYCLGRLSPRWRRWVDRILWLMYERHRLTREELDRALATPVLFSREEFEGYARCKARIRRYLRGF